ncbi:MAG: hypothetical protein NZ866_02525 [Patescibacteria group bacterium]|nr:hypothetical protein [Patescibacteria group bacterium]
MKKYSLKAFTVFESTIVLLVTTVIIGATLALGNWGKIFRKFQENVFLFNQDLKTVLNKSIDGGEFNLNGSTSTLCASGILISQREKNYYQIAYATISTSSVIDCSEIASSSPENFNFSLNQPQLFLSEMGNFTNSINEALKINLELVENIRLATDTYEIDFSTASIMFIYPYGEPIVYYSTGTRSYQLNFNDYLKILFIRGNERATTTIYKSGKIHSK